ncbi:protein kinase domain-containing protein [Nocardia arthritidis]|uniref:protein kinase domain-containing protein n=1 Tax=Nocardia arthritidis TaxID=228602 RepID=UPI001EEC7CE5|nr:hypothetical protein [Nocardia arthritidis]
MAYVAPERLNGHEGDPASDLWSLGVLLFAAVEGYHPLQRNTDVATLAAILRAEVPPPRQAGALTPVIQALLVPDPARRPSAEQLEVMLAQAVTDRTPATQQWHLPTAPITPRRTVAPWIAAGSAAAIAATIAAAVILWPKPSGPQALPGPAQPTSTEAAAPTTKPATPTPNTKPHIDLLTPGGIRGAIAALEKATGGTEFTATTVYLDNIDTGAPVKDQPKVYDRYTFRDGKTIRTGPGSTLTKPTVNLGKIDWDILPKLLDEAPGMLNVPTPTHRYLIIDPAWGFNNDQPTILLYLGDDYGSGYLAANPDGTIVRTYPHGS